MSHSGPDSERALIFTPNGRDGQLAALILQQSGFLSQTLPDLASLCREIERGAGLAILAEEAVHNADLRQLSECLRGQPPWSDFPIILLTLRGGGPERNPAASRHAELLGNVIFMERPFHPTTMVSLVRTAVRGRRRQYIARKHLHDLAEGERKLQTALRAGHLGAWTLDVDGMVLRASPSCQAHFGRCSEEPFSYGDLLASVHPDDRTRMQDAVARTLQTHGDYIVEYRNIWPDGSVHWVDVRARVLTNDAGKVMQLVGVSSDITARKSSDIERNDLLAELAYEREALSELTATLEERVQVRTSELMAEIAARERAQEQLLQSQKMESIGKLTGGVAHDFNNLLMAVMGNLELLRKKVPDDPRVTRLIDGALQGAERGAALTQRMLAFARRQDLSTRSVNLGDLLCGMRELLERTLGPQIALNLTIPDGLPHAEVDANQIELAILNLAINSRDAMAAGGTIEIELDEQKAYSGGKLASGDYLTVRVSDTGSGMDAATLKMAIEPFFSTKPVGKGTGLGLSMVHGLAVQLGGLLELSSEAGKGTSATLWLPVATAPAVEQDAGRPNVGKMRPATILVVDDDPLIAMSTVDMLEDLGHTVIEANSGKRALEILETGPAVDLLMTDHAMPGMTGTELADLAHKKRPDLPVLLATGYADLPNGQKTDLPRLSKPYHQAQLRTEINRLLNGKD